MDARAMVRPGFNRHAYDPTQQHPEDPRSDEQDPPLWTSPPRVRHMVGVIRDKLGELDPAQTAGFAVDPTAADYVDNLRRVGRQLAGAEASSSVIDHRRARPPTAQGQMPEEIHE